MQMQDNRGILYGKHVYNQMQQWLVFMVQSPPGKTGGNACVSFRNIVSRAKLHNVRVIFKEEININ